MQPNDHLVGRSLTRLIRARWWDGPHVDADGPVVVSLTMYRADRMLALPGVIRTGLGLGLGWYGMSGAVGLWLYVQPGRRRVGSISIWTRETELRRFVGLPHHIRIMRHYRTRGALTSDQWHEERFERDRVWGEAARRLTAPAAV